MPRPSKKFKMEKWREEMSVKLGEHITQEKASILLGFKDRSIIIKIEGKFTPASKQTIMLARLLLQRPCGELRGILEGTSELGI